MDKIVKPSTRSFLHSPISENGPSDIQGERATSPFSILREWEKIGVTTPNPTKLVVNEMCDGLEQVPCPVLPSFSNSSYFKYIEYKLNKSLQGGIVTYNNQWRGAQNGAFQWKLSDNIQPIASSCSHHAQISCSYEKLILEHTRWS